MSESSNLEKSSSNEVVTRKKRRNYTVSYKLSILEQADACNKPGEVGALLRKEGLYSSSLTKWRREREQGILSALNSKKRGKKPIVKNPDEAENQALRKKNAELKKQLEQAELILDFQKKASQIYGIVLEQPNQNGKNK